MFLLCGANKLFSFITMNHFLKSTNQVFGRKKISRKKNIRKCLLCSKVVKPLDNVLWLIDNAKWIMDNKPRIMDN